MAQYNNPFTGVPVGWDDGEDGWGQPLNTTLLQYAFYHSRNVNGVVATVDDIPLSAANGSAYLVQENQRVYFASNLTWYFSVPPDGMKFRLVTNGRYYSKTSTGFVLDDEISEVAYSGDASDLTTGTLNVARTPAFTGDVTKPAGSATLTLSASGVTAGSYGATDYTYLTATIDEKGRVTSATNKTIPDASTTVKGLMSSDDKTKLNSVASGAEANVNADWNSVAGDSQILNKPTLGNLSSVNATPVGLNLVQSTNPTASIVFPRINADNTVSLLNDVDMKAALNITGGGGGEGSVTSVGLTVPLGFSTNNSPITSAGNIGLTFATGYSLPTNAKQTNWDTAFGWGNHASAGYAVNGTGGTEVRTNTQLDGRYLQSFTETDPTVPSHVKGITTTNVSNWNTAYTDRNKWDGGATGLNAATGRDSLDVQVKTKVVNTALSDYEISSSDVYSLIRFTLIGDKTVSILNNTNSVLPDNGQWNIRNVGTGDLTVVPETGVTINGAGGSLVVPSGGTVTIIKVGTNEYDLIGSLVPTASEWITVEAIGDGLTNNQSSFDDAISKFNAYGVNGNVKGLKVPAGVVVLDELSLPTGCSLVGAGIDKTILKLSSSDNLTPRKAHSSTVDQVQTYLPFVYSESADTGAFNASSNIHVSGFTIDWNNQPAFGYGAAPLWLGCVDEFSVSRVRVINNLPSDYNIVSSAGRGVSVLLTFCSNGTVKNCRFDGVAGYEELGIRYSNKAILVERNLFAGKGPWRHNIEIAGFFAVPPSPTDITIRKNVFNLHGAKQDCISCHNSGTIKVKDNKFVVMDDLINTNEGGKRCLVKKFDGNDGALIVSGGNEFDFTNVPLTVTQAFECIRAWSANVTITGNFFKGRIDGFTADLWNPWVGNSDGSYDSMGLVITNNQFELHQYSGDVELPIIKTGNRGAVVHGNVLTLVNPIDISSKAGGVVFVDANGAIETESGNSSGVSLSIVGNSTYSSVPNSIAVGYRVRGSSNNYTVMANTAVGAKVKVEDLGAVGATKYIGGNV